MRFHIKEYKSFVAEIEKASFSTEDFDFVKKSGRLNIIHRASKERFSYHRKRVTEIDGQGQWTHHYEYYLEIEKKKQAVEKEAVEPALAQWLQRLPKD